MVLSKNKKGVTVYKDWAEMVSLLLLVVGFALSIASDSIVITYIILVLCGFLVGRVYYFREKNIKFPFYLIVAFFLLGYVIGVKVRDRGGFFLSFFFFFLGAYISYALHERRYFK